MNEVFGIDLGTTYSAIGYIDGNGLPVVVNNDRNSPTTASVVYFESPDNVIIGDTAKSTARITPERVVSLVKRDMGNPRTWEFDGRKHSPESISALILKQLVAMAVEDSGIESNKVVITVPAYFGVLQKDATRKAGEIAGLDVVAILTEPLAAAVSYDMKWKSDVTKTVLIYDLGGGTFDTTVVRVDPTGLHSIVIDGDRELGGADWDAAFLQHVLERFVAEVAPEGDPGDDDFFLQSLADEIEEVKKRFSHIESASIVLTFNGTASSMVVTRNEFEEITKFLLDRTLNVVKRTLATATDKIPGLVIDELYLVGGSSRMVAVKETLKRELGLVGILREPEMSVVKGATIFGMDPFDPEPAPIPVDPNGTSAGNETSNPSHGLPPVKRGVFNVMSKSLGVRFVDPRTDEFFVKFAINANDSLPASPLPLPAQTAEEGQTSIAIRLFEQDSEKPSPEMSSNREVSIKGGMEFTGLPNLPVGTPVEITIAVNSEGLVALSALLPLTGQRLDAVADVSVLQKDEVDAYTAKVSDLIVSA